MPVTSSEVKESEKGTQFLSFLSSMPLNLPSSLLLPPLPLLPPFFPNFLLWAFQVNQSSQLHFFPSIPLLGFSLKLFLFPFAQGIVSLLTSFSDKFPLSVSHRCFFHHGSNDPFFKERSILPMTQVQNLG